MKKVFTVHGSEDGMQGVFTNKKLAYASAVAYTNNNGGPVLSYSQVCKEFKDGMIVTVESKGGYGSARIEEFILNA